MRVIGWNMPDPRATAKGKCKVTSRKVVASPRHKPYVMPSDERDRAAERLSANRAARADAERFSGNGRYARIALLKEGRAFSINVQKKRQLDWPATTASQRAPTKN